MTIRTKLLPGLAIDSFVEDDSNRLAFTAALQCAEQPGKVHNPLLIHGATGLGKTHLVHAIAHTIISRQRISYPCLIQARYPDG